MRKLHQGPLTWPFRLKPTTILSAALVLALALASTRPALAQPFGGWLNLNGAPQHGYLRIPDSNALDITGAITIEGWVNLTDPSGCSSIIGKGFLSTWWIGICGTTLRSYLKGSSSAYTVGTLPPGQWTHFAVVFNGNERRHYINGELVGIPRIEPGALPTNSSEIRIGSDVDWQLTPDGAIDEIRIWNVARTQSQLRAAINLAVQGPEPGLVAHWGLNGNGTDSIGGHNGSNQGAGIGFLTFPVTIVPCTTTPTSLCLHDRFVITARFRTGPPGTAEGTGQVVSCENDGSGLFWFFSPTNWEVMAKAINGCGLNNRYWVFSAATTNVFYRLEAFDRHAGANKVYFNYQGPPAAAVVDTNAFATCP